MSVTIPTATSIRMRFPEFSGVADATIEFAIEEARTEVSDSWTDQYDIALVYLVAHYVASSIAAAASGGEGGTGQIASESIGRLSVSYAQEKSSNADATCDDKESTSYGRRYLEILGANFSGPLIV